MVISPVQALWSSLFITAIYPIVGKVSGGLISPSLLICIATAMAVLFYSPWLTRNKLWGNYFKKEIFKRLIFIGLFGTALPFLLILMALNYTTPGNAAILNQVEVVYSLILTYVFLKERPSGKQLLGTLLVILGATLVLFNDDFSIRWKGDLMVICTVWMFQVSHIFAKKLPAHLPPQFIAAGRALYGFMWIVPITVILSFFKPVQIEASWGVLGILVYMGFINYALGNALWYKAIRNMDLSKATAVILSYPVFTYIMSVLVGLDKINALQIAGLILAVTGAYTVTNIIKKGTVKK